MMEEIEKDADTLKMDRDIENQQIIDGFKNNFNELFGLYMSCIGSSSRALKVSLSQFKKIDDNIKNLSLLKRIYRYFGLKIYLKNGVEYNKSVEYFDFINSKKDEIEFIKRNIIKTMHKLESMHYFINNDEYPNGGDILKIIIEEYQTLNKIKDDIFFISDIIEKYTDKLMEMFK